MMSTGTQKSRFHSLNCLKFILAVVIVFHHFQQTLDVKFAHINFFHGKIYFGYAVEFFFIIPVSLLLFN